MIDRFIERSKKAGLLLALLGTAACGSDGGTTPDGGSTTCDPLPEAQVTCTAPTCSATTGTKTFGQAELASTAAQDWLVVSWATSEVAAANENTEVSYGRAVKNGLSAPEGGRRPKPGLSPEALALAYSPERVARLEAEHRIRALSTKKPKLIGPLFGTAIQPRDLVPAGARRQTTACGDANPSVCGPTALCVIPEGASDGTCASNLSLKFYGLGPTAAAVDARVRKVGQKIAIVVDTANDAAVSAADVDALVKRFDEHIAPRVHGLFGEPTFNGKDRDKNGVVTVFLTSRVSNISASLVGFFFGDDMLSTAERAHSNAADILYMQPPGGSITLDAISGTIGHEYQHIINYTSKVLKNGSDREEVWLDEGLACFAEDILGYGRDTFTNVLAYLGAPGDTSMTGFGLVHSSEQDADSFERRGFAALLVRYIFEQSGGADYPAAGGGALTDKGGVTAVRRLVQGSETGQDAVAAVQAGRAYPAWLGDLLLTVGIDGTKDAKLACQKKYNLAEPAADAYTQFQRGLDLRTTITVPGGQPIPLTGPTTATLENEEVPFPLNGGEFRTVNVASGIVEVTVGGPADAKIAFRAVPKP